jgi:hypothetical protein
MATKSPKGPEGFLADKERGVYAVPDQVSPEPKPKPKLKPKSGPKGFLADKRGIYAVPDPVSPPPKKFKSGGSIDGCAQRGLTQGRIV